MTTDADASLTPSRPVEIAIPDLSLVVLIGISGAGKSTFARAHFRSTQVLSSDFCRRLVTDDENDQAATPAAFDVLHDIAGTRLRVGRLTVVDATNVKREDRAKLVQLARDHDVLPVAIVLDVPESVAVERNAARADRDMSPGVVRRQRADLRRGLRGLSREGFRKVHVLSGLEQIASASVSYEKQYNDRREDTGPFDVVGDVHGCRTELERLLGELGYQLRSDESGRSVDAVHPQGRRAVFVGDLVDRGPDSPGVLRLVMGMVAGGNALCVPGNHENKLVKALRGRNVTISHGLETTLAQLQAEDERFRKQVEEFCYGLVSHYVLDGGNLVVAHAGLKESLQGRSSGRVRDFALYGESTGETDEFGLPVRYPWAKEYRGRATVLYGHTPVPEPEWINNTLCLDTASRDSDVDLRGVHLLPAELVVRLRTGPQTLDRSWVRDGVEMDLVTHDLAKFARLLLRRNGYVLEQLLSLLVVTTSPAHEPMIALAPACLTRHHAHHYLGFARTQYELFRRTDELKPLPYTIRVLLTGIHLMRTGKVQAHLPTLLECVPEAPGWVADAMQHKAQAEHTGNGGWCRRSRWTPTTIGSSRCWKANVTGPRCPRCRRRSPRCTTWSSGNDLARVG